MGRTRSAKERTFEKPLRRDLSYKSYSLFSLDFKHHQEDRHGYWMKIKQKHNYVVSTMPCTNTCSEWTHRDEELNTDMLLSFHT